MKNYTYAIFYSGNNVVGQTEVFTDDPIDSHDQMVGVMKSIEANNGKTGLVMTGFQLLSSPVVAKREFIERYVSSYLGAAMANHEQTFMGDSERNYQFCCEHQPVEDAVFNANKAWELFQKNCGGKYEHS